MITLYLRQAYVMPMLSGSFCFLREIVQGLDLSHYIIHWVTECIRTPESWISLINMNRYSHGFLMLKGAYSRDILLSSSLCTTYRLSYKNHQKLLDRTEEVGYRFTVQTVDKTPPKKNHPGCKNLWTNAKTKSVTCLVALKCWNCRAGSRP